jgi:hypothetical protein
MIESEKGNFLKKNFLHVQCKTGESSLERGKWGCRDSPRLTDWKRSKE